MTEFNLGILFVLMIIVSVLLDSATISYRMNKAKKRAEWFNAVNDRLDGSTLNPKGKYFNDLYDSGATVDEGVDKANELFSHWFNKRIL